MWTTVISHPPSGGSARVARAVCPKLAEPGGEVNAGLQAQGHGLLWRGSCHRPPTAPVNRPLLLPRHVSLCTRRTDSLRSSGPEPSDWFPSMFRRSFLRIMPDPPRLSPPRAGRVPPTTGSGCFPACFARTRRTDSLWAAGRALDWFSCMFRRSFYHSGAVPPVSAPGRPGAPVNRPLLLPRHVSQEFPANHAGSVPPVSAPGPPGAADDLQPGNHAGCLKTVSNFPCLDRFRSASFQNALVDSAQDKRSASCGGGRGDAKCFRKRSRFVAAGTAEPEISAPVRPSTQPCAAGW